jgi:hypothetical protein
MFWGRGSVWKGARKEGRTEARKEKKEEGRTNGRSDGRTDGRNVGGWVGGGGGGRKGKEGRKEGRKDYVLYGALERPVVTFVVIAAVVVCSLLRKEHLKGGKKEGKWNS